MTTSLDTFVLLFAQASLNCLAVAVGVWAALKLAVRIRPGLAAQRPVWMLSQVLVAAAFVLVLLPQTGQFSVLPDIAFESMPVAEELDSTSTPVRIEPAQRPIARRQTDHAPTSAWLEGLAYAWMAFYVAGLLHIGTRWVAARRELRRFLISASVLDEADLLQHPAFDETLVRRVAQYGLEVLETPAAVSPMLVGLIRPRLLLPRHLRDFDLQQQQMIVAHELTHWRRRDPLWLCASLVLQTVLWFNPVVRKLGARLNWAQELSCDRIVLNDRPQLQRQQYAAALVAQLKLQRTMSAWLPQAALAFGDASAETLGARIQLIRQNGMTRLGLLSQCIVAGGLITILCASILLQPAFAWRADRVDATAATAADAPHDASAATALPAWRYPLEKIRVNSFYGVPRNEGKSTHGGIDLDGRTGTPILAPADGIVIASTDDGYAGNPKYGKVIVIQHDSNLRSLYAHLDRRAVEVGDTVKAGQRIGTIGVSGTVTGPHLHFEVMRGEQRIDPERVLAGLDKHGTATALRKRELRATH